MSNSLGPYGLDAPSPRGAGAALVIVRHRLLIAAAAPVAEHVL